jgi:DNA-binding IclR family transcriptional regulator
MSDERYRSASQQRILRVLLALAGNEVNGLAPGELARGLQIGANQVTHDLRNLRIAGLAEEIPDLKRWRLSPRIPQIAVAMLHGIDRTEQRLTDTRQRYTREPR